ncbi:MAG: HAMP domain-containing histidine kinase [Firmicutes bacterium]|nr:HAMP domain-containing histidine kinase [Alicyclobacillaceae bacterium]MCL6496593.1 HAMP domain-containing histidine kinase [Bacillota bacterium]
MGAPSRTRPARRLVDELIGRQILLLAVLLGILGISQFLILRQVLDHARMATLRSELALVAPLLAHTPPDLSRVAAFLVERLHEPGVTVVVTDAGGHPLAVAPAGGPIPTAPGFTPSQWFVASLPIGPPLHPVGRLWLLASRAPVNHILQRDMEIFVFFGLLALAGTGWLGSVSVRHSLAPLAAIIESTVRIAHGDYGHTTDLEGAPAELAELGDAVNRMSVAIKESFDQEKALAEQMRRFLADASHELRTPLTAINGFVDLLQRESLSASETRTALAAVAREGHRMARLVNQLLTLSRLESAPESQVQIAPLALEQWWTEAVPVLERVAAPHAIVARVEPVEVWADRDRLSEIVLNLVENAQRYSPPGAAIEIHIAAEGPWGVIEVADRGPGIASDVLPHIFERFYRGDRARTAAAGGSGLGLSIAQALVLAQHGLIEAQNRPDGPGARFRVQLPRVAEAASGLSR